MYEREREWNLFSDLVKKHIIGYTIPQWGDYPHDQITNWSIETCIDQAKKYLNRYGTNQRPGQEELDLLKAAHFICVSYMKMLNSENKEVLVTIPKSEYEELLKYKNEEESRRTL